MDRRRLAGSTTESLVLLLAILSGAGAWNYYRNVQLERAEARGRAFSGYSTRDVITLRDAAATDPQHAKLARDLDEELKRRESLGAGLSLHLKRLTGF